MIDCQETDAFLLDRRNVNLRVNIAQEGRVGDISILIELLKSVGDLQIRTKHNQIGIDDFIKIEKDLLVGARQNLIAVVGFAVVPPYSDRDIFLGRAGHFVIVPLDHLHHRVTIFVIEGENLFAVLDPG